ncbi:Spc7-domain-containing protein [Aaosphaeria arxii CBS 175.79]|uniref:Spc7-domain-containing protein n=1 Tax=Aaosphaeria arxii CBS 175.79 TaxID=1450172 RepID=A0A6A5YBN5_9PLEO|nr:Spc7-domain-containing protein [Aaosphaeria arxii CBS 175.79]KAF2022014.1 Spc7-domain-containing protein [Aaosphaeria arxii CBS 175.79]
MANGSGKENIADGLVAAPTSSAPSRNRSSSLSPKKSARRTRSKSIGPGGLNALEEPALKESKGNRRKSAFIPAVKSILASNDEDEKKRREARRKSLAKRRVSFAPEATLHTWDVVEYLRDATTSSASSDATRRASEVSQASTGASPGPSFDVEEPPSTPPEQVEEREPEVESSPANQRDLHQKKNRRRSSGIPPMNFNNPGDILSSSPASGDNDSSGGDDIVSDSEDNEESGAKNNASPSEDSTASSGRLDAALRQATAHAETQRLDFDDDGDKTMELADEITATFTPWIRKPAATPLQDQDGMDPFYPALPATTPSDEEGDEEEMSMDITRAMGRIVPPASSQDDVEDISMDLTMPLGAIQQSSTQENAGRRKSLKRRVSMLEGSQGSPAKRPTGRRTSLRNRTQPEEASSPGDMTMEFTTAIGGITSKAPGPKQAASRRNSVETSFGDATMDFTVAMGSIKDAPAPPHTQPESSDQDDDDEDMSMEFTTVVGGIQLLNKQISTPEKHTTGVSISTPSKIESPTPVRSVSKSPAKRKLSDLKPTKPLPSPKQASVTPQKSPDARRKGATLLTPDTIPAQVIEDFEPSPFVRTTPQISSTHDDRVSTPVDGSSAGFVEAIPGDPIAAPILNRRRSSLSSVHYSPLATAPQVPVLKAATSLADNIKLLSTPRKQALSSPVKRGAPSPFKSRSPQKALTPKQKASTPKKATPRRSVSPQKRVAFGAEPEQEDKGNLEDEHDGQPDEEVERISLQEFLDMTKIRFMDLSTTKRRHTAAPAAFRDTEVEEKEESLDRYVVAAACTLPEFELYQHACHEMKKYISDGRHFVRTMEANVMEDNPLLFSEYLTAPPDQRAVMDNQFKNLKTNARLEARGEWYSWRSTLLHDLKNGLLGTMSGLKRDEGVLAKREKLLDSVLPSLEEQHGQLQVECSQLQQRHDELNSCDREELELTREQLQATDSELASKRRVIAELQSELANKEAFIQAAKERKVECVHQIKEAERVREEYRGWSTTEVNGLRAKVTTLERAHGWSITSASSKAITMAHLNDLELYFQPSAFATGADTPNASISLTYIGDTATPHPRPLTTSKRFFLQLLRGHLHSIPQSQTRIRDVLALVKNGWSTALAVAEGARWLEHSYITDEFILSDERMGISSNMLLPTLQTKVRVTFEIGVALTPQGIETQVEPKAELIYGEKYKVKTMCDFLSNFCGDTVKGEKDMDIWANGVIDLAAKLKATGRKGERA